MGYSPCNSLGQNTGVGRLSLLQGIFPTQRWNPGFPHCRQILYQLSHEVSLRILDWITYPLLQWIFPTQESNQGLLPCRRILHQLSYQGLGGLQIIFSLRLDFLSSTNPSQSCSFFKIHLGQSYLKPKQC